jgi:hypothetical protein
MAITTGETEYLIVILLVGGFATMIINSLFTINNLTVGILGLLAVAYIFKLK